MLGWFDKYPEYKENDFYLSGESYAGIYVPYLLNQIHSHNQMFVSDDTVFKPNLKGMIVGNGVTNWTFDTLPAMVDTFYWHSLIDQDRYDRSKELGCNWAGVEFGKDLSDECSDMLDYVSKTTARINPYDIFGTCWGVPSSDGSHEKHYTRQDRALTAVGGKLKTHKRVFTPRDYTPWFYRQFPNQGLGDDEDIDCTFGAPIHDYLNR